MALVTKEFAITSATPVKILPSALFQRQIYIETTAGIIIGSSSAGSPDGIRMANGGVLTFALASGDELWAWADTGSTGTVQILSSSALLA